MTASLKKVTQIIFSFSVLIFVSSSCNPGSQKVDISTNIDAVKKYHQVWSDGNIEELDKIIAPNFTSHFIGGFEYKGIDGAKNSVLETKKAFPDWK